MEINKIYQGSALEVLKTFPDESIDCCISSPPYWGLRAYGTNPQIWDGDINCQHEFQPDEIKRVRGVSATATVGNNLPAFEGIVKQVNYGGFCTKCGAWSGELGSEPIFKLYIQHLLLIFNEVHRVLKPTGTCWINLGDTYYGGGGGNQYGPNNRGFQSKAFKSNPELEKSAAISYAFRKKAKELPNKCKCMIPERFAIEMINTGWILRNEIIWHKPNCTPSSATDKFTVDYEKIFFFVKNKKYYFNQLKEPIAQSTLDTCKYLRKSKKYQDGTAGGLTKDKTNAHLLKLRKTKGVDGRIKRCVWRIPTKSFKGSHFATFPTTLVEPMLMAGCPEDGVVLDPFMGAGTVGVVAKQNRRNYVGIELNNQYIEMAENRINKTEVNLL